MNGKESPSTMIDRLVLGIPFDLTKVMQRLAEAGWSHREIAAEFYTTQDAVTARLYRARRDAR